MMKKESLAVAAMALTSLAALTSCETNAGTGALVGAGAGALIGGTAGGGHGYYHHGGGSAEGAIAGAAIGAAAGALVGAAVDADERGYYRGHPAEYYPYGRWVGRGLVQSPYPPHAVVDVRGIPHDALVQDPDSGRPFRKP